MTHDGTATFVEKHRTPETGEALSSPTLPSELVAQAAQRLSYAAFLYAVAYSLAYLPNRLIQPAGMPHPVMDIVAAAFVLGSVALALAVRRLDLDALSDDLRERILQTAGRLGYRGPNPAGRILRS